MSPGLPALLRHHPPGANGPDTAIYLDGANVGAAVTRYDFPTKSVTLEAWVMRGRDDVGERVFSFGVDAPDDSQHDGTSRDGRRAMHFGFHGSGRGSSRLRFGFPCRSTRTFLDAPPGLVPGEFGADAPHLEGARRWHHVAATYDAATGQRRIYVDGRRAASDAADASYRVAGDFTLGGVGSRERYPREELLPDVACAVGTLSCFDTTDGSTPPRGAFGDGDGDGAGALDGAALGGFVGKVDEARVWGVALTARQLAEFSFLSGNAIIAAHPASASLAGYYRFNEGSGTTVHDWSAHGRHLMLSRGYAELPRTRRVMYASSVATEREMLGGGETTARSDDAFYGLQGGFYGVRVGAGGGGDVDELGDDALSLGVHGFYGVDAAGGGEDARWRGLGDGPGRGDGGGESAAEGGDGDESSASHLPSAWMEGVGKRGCCATYCQLCEGGYRSERHTVGGRVSGM